MARPRGVYSETYNLATRFLNVMRALAQVAQYRVPDSIVENLSVNQLRTLQMIQDDPGLTQKALSERLEITAASVSIAVSKMVNLDLIEKHPDEDDGRVMRLYLGPRGQELVRVTEDFQNEIVSELLGGLPADDQRMIVELLEHALAAQQERTQNENAP